MRLINRQLETLSSLPKILGLLSVLLSQFLSPRHSQDKVLNNVIQVLEYKITYNKDGLTARILWAIAVDPLVGFSTVDCP